ncbi:regulatory signaling modulator protein AmpE [Lysobacter solisilvae (ex Woo and Kim 2020)]|uniref:Regulatory signaling modulator protein AmpE n=1 Tax=Agrilutibacter terrestris TaxID=2865112 RepID=A0A7H0FZX5_9GAMM|nr:regulatory signaling modulator protein AmpE [Lysobacter terrestris]QNP41591.1 regulatory signaling modulator protein AmpE [Lysobacter terrestris]
MAVTLLAVVAALVIGHMAQSLVASVRHYDWYGNWMDWLGAQFPEGSVWRGRGGIALALVPPLLAVLLFQAALDRPFYGLVGVLFAIAVLLYAWGPRDLDLDIDAIVDAPDAAARREAMAALWPDNPPLTIDGGALVSAVFQNALRRWFGVLFWFLLLGPVGALLYRLAVLSSEGGFAHRLPLETRQGAQTLLKLLDWPVAQLLTLALALVGNFDTVLGAWREAGGASFTLDHRFLDAAGRASVRTELAEEAADYADEAADAGVTGEAVAMPIMATTSGLPELRDAMSLVWRSLLVWLAVLALFVIAGFVA